MRHRKIKFDPALPLRNARHEAFARHVVVMEKPLRAMQLAGYAKATQGNAAALNRHPQIVARVRWLSARDNDLEMRRLRRNRLRHMYETMALADRTKVFEEIEVPERDDDGNVIMIDGKPLMKIVRDLRSFDEMSDDERMLIEGLEFDGDKYKTKLVCRLACMKALRDLDGLDQPGKIAFTDPDGQPMTAAVPVINLSGRPESPP